MRALENTARNLALEIDDPFAFSLAYRAALHSNAVILSAKYNPADWK
jgi:hypothetical protein